MTAPDLSRVQCGYCTRRAHVVEWEGDAQIPVCKDHARRASRAEADVRVIRCDECGAESPHP